MSLRIIACGIFQDALSFLEIDKVRPDVHVTFLSPYLHNQPCELEKELLSHIDQARRKKEKIICIYGHCLPNMDDLLEGQNVRRIEGQHCYQMLLGAEAFQNIMNEDAGTYFLEKQLICHFDEYCKQPLELDDTEMKRDYFRHYRRILYIRQPRDADLLPQCLEIARFLGLKLQVRDADYGELRTNLLKLIFE